MSSTRKRRRTAFSAGLLLVLGALGGCARSGMVRQPEAVDTQWAKEIERRGVHPPDVVNPLRFTAEMRRTARQFAGVGSPVMRLRSLQRNLFNEEQFPYDYDSKDSLTAIEAFETRTGNCVSFTNLFIALARSLGLAVRAALLTDLADVEKKGELIVVNNHIVAIYEHSGGATVFDFNRAAERSTVGLHIIDDAWLTAIYLNNRGAEALFAGLPERALSFLRTTVQLAPEFAEAYGNMGIVKRRLGDIDGAFDAYRRALEIEPRHPAILTNLAVLYRSLGHEAEAQDALRAADLRGATPYLLLIRGDFLLAEGRHRAASRLYRKAARLAPDSAEPWLAIARAEASRGRIPQARAAAERALATDEDNDLARALLQRLGRPDPPG